MLRFEKFKREHYDEYNSWFKNERIKKALFDIEGEWLDFVLSDKTGIEYVVYEGKELSAVVGIILPTKKHTSYGIKNIAVRPDRFGEGLGSVVLKELYKLHPLEDGQFWLAFVDCENLSAQVFFEKNGWKRNVNGETEDNMIRFEYWLS